MVKDDRLAQVYMKKELQNSARMHSVFMSPPKTQNILQHHAKIQHLFLHAAMQAQGMSVKNPCNHIYHQIFAAVQHYTKSTNVYGWQQLFPLFVGKNSDVKIKRHSHSGIQNTIRPDRWRRDHTGNKMEGHSQKWQMGTKVCVLPRARVGSVWHPGYEERRGGKGHEWKGDRLLGQSEGASISDREQRFMKTGNGECDRESMEEKKREIDSRWLRVKEWKEEQGRSAVRSHGKQQH